MKLKSGLLLFFFVVAMTATSQNSQVYRFFNKGIDAIVAGANDVDPDYDEEKSNHVYSRLFSIPLLYSSVIRNACAGSESEGDCDSHMISMDRKRADAIDRLLLDMYRTHPERIAMTEEVLLQEQTLAGVVAEKKPALEMANAKVDIPENVAGGMKTTVVKPNYWTTSGSIAMNFTQNYISDNWYQGGESNKTMICEFDFDVNYNDKDRISFRTHFDADLGFATTKADTLHSLKTNTDRLRIESNLGYKLIKNLDATVKVKLESQSMPSYYTNSHDFASNFMAPFDANFSVGLNYKPTIKKIRLEIFFAPLSAYNYRFVRYGKLTSRYGIRAGRHHKEDFGTQLMITVPRQKISQLVNWYSKAEFYSNYARTFFQWENKFDVSLNRYLTASLNLYARFDDSAPRLKDEEFGYWQLKEFMTLGVTYSW